MYSINMLVQMFLLFVIGLARSSWIKIFLMLVLIQNKLYKNNTLGNKVKD